MKGPNPFVGPIPGSAGFLHVIFAFISFLLPLIGNIVYIAEVNTANHVVELIFLTLLSGIALFYSGTNVYKTFYNFRNASKSFWTSFTLILVYMSLYSYYIWSMVKEKEKK